jgi:hypothetical protein
VFHISVTLGRILPQMSIDYKGLKKGKIEAGLKKGKNKEKKG